MSDKDEALPPEPGSEPDLSHGFAESAVAGGDEPPPDDQELGDAEEAQGDGDE